MEFNFATQRRAELRPKSAAPKEESDHIVHANPFPTEIFEKPALPARRSRRPATIATSPNLTKPSSRPEQKEQPIFEFRAQPLPADTQVFRPLLPHSHTEPVPFGVAAKDPMVTRKRLAEKVMQEQAQLREFKARGIPSFDSIEVNIAPVKPPTNPEPFAMPGERISKRKLAALEEKVKRIVWSIFIMFQAR